MRAGLAIASHPARTQLALGLHSYRAMRLSDETLRGRSVLAADGTGLGEVVGMFVDDDGWRIESVRVKLERRVADHLGASRSLFHAATIEVPVRMIQSVGDVVILSVRVDELRQVLGSEAVDAASAPLT